MKILEAPKIRFPDIRKRADGIRVGFKDKSMPLNISDAHELGHYYLHEHYRSFKRIEDWISLAGILFDKCNFGIPTSNIAQRLRREGLWESVCSSVR